MGRQVTGENRAKNLQFDQKLLGSVFTEENNHVDHNRAGFVFGCALYCVLCCFNEEFEVILQVNKESDNNL